MMRALGMPMVPDELCDPVEVLEAGRAAGANDDAGWMREAAAMLGLSPDEVAEVIRPAPVERMDH